jgi:hypothetical protein
MHQASPSSFFVVLKVQAISCICVYFLYMSFLHILKESSISYGVSMHSGWLHESIFSNKFFVKIFFKLSNHFFVNFINFFQKKYHHVGCLSTQDDSMSSFFSNKFFVKIFFNLSNHFFNFINFFPKKISSCGVSIHSGWLQESIFSKNFFINLFVEILSNVFDILSIFSKKCFQKFFQKLFSKNFIVWGVYALRMTPGVRFKKLSICFHFILLTFQNFANLKNCFLKFLNCAFEVFCTFTQEILFFFHLFFFFLR